MPPNLLLFRVVVGLRPTSHAVAISDGAHGSIQQPAHNPVAVQTCCLQSHFLPYMNVMPQLMTS